MQRGTITDKDGEREQPENFFVVQQLLRTSEK